MQKYIFYLFIITQFAYSGSIDRLFYSLNYSKPYFNDDIYEDDISFEGNVSHNFGFNFGSSSKILRAEIALSGRTYTGSMFLEDIKDSHLFLETALKLPFQIPISFINSSYAGTWDIAIGCNFSYPLISYREINGKKLIISNNCSSDDCIEGIIENDYGLVISSGYSSPIGLGITIGHYIGFRNMESRPNDNFHEYDNIIFGQKLQDRDFKAYHAYTYIRLIFDI